MSEYNLNAKIFSILLLLPQFINFLFCKTFSDIIIYDTKFNLVFKHSVVIQVGTSSSKARKQSTTERIKYSCD